VRCCVAVFVSCVALRLDCGVMNWYRQLVLNGTCFSEPRASDLFMAKVNACYCGLTRVLHVET
jgi:hypothetical protein